MGTSICIASGKGGVGKSTISVNLGVALSKIGVNPIIVDGDLEGTSIWSLIGVDKSLPTIHDYLSGELAVEDVIIYSDGANFVVGGLEIDKLRNIDLDRFKDLVDQLVERFDLVLVDCAPGLGKDAVTAISSCVTMLLIVTPDITSIMNALKTILVAKRTGCTILGVLVNRSMGEYDIPDEQISSVLGFDIIGRIPEDNEVKKAGNIGKPMVTYNPESQFSQKIMDLASRLIGV